MTIHLKYTFSNIILSLTLFLLPIIGFAAPSSQEVSTTLANIWVYLNHQDFTKATGLSDGLLEKISLEDAAKDLVYEDFITLLQTLKWQDAAEKLSEIITLRERYHPEDSSKAAFLTRKDQTQFWKSCNATASSVFLDEVDMVFCIVSKKDISPILKRKITRDFIKKNYPLILSGDDLQKASDLGNFLSQASSIDPIKKSLYAQYQKSLWKKIIITDPHWVNGYFFLIANARSSIEKKKWIDALIDGYTGDLERWRTTVIPFISSF